jgi:hypothetical protein
VVFLVQHRYFTPIPAFPLKGGRGISLSPGRGEVRRGVKTYFI